jgi:predicted phosphatase
VAAWTASAYLDDEDNHLGEIYERLGGLGDVSLHNLSDQDLLANLASAGPAETATVLP